MLTHQILDAVIWHLYRYLADLSGLKKQGIGGRSEIQDWIKQYLLEHGAKEEIAKPIASFNWREAVRRGEITLEKLEFLMEDLDLGVERISIEIFNQSERYAAEERQLEAECLEQETHEGLGRW